MKKLLILGALFLALLPAACDSASRRAERVFSQADILMDHAPDSALTLIESIMDDSLPPELNARRALLLAKARSKSFSYIFDDSLIAIATDFYEGRGDSLEVQALYYAGASHFENNHYDNALIDFHSAYGKAIANKDDFYAAMCARFLGNLYARLYISDKSHEWNDTAKLYFARAGKKVHEDWIDLSRVSSLIYLKRYDDALRLGDTLNPDLMRGNKAFRHEAMFYRARIYRALDDYEKVKAIYDSLRADGYNFLSHDYCVLSNVAIATGDIAGAQEYFDSAKSIMALPEDTLYIGMLVPKLYAARGDYENAYKTAFQWALDGFADGDRRINRPPTLLLTDFFIQKARLEELKASQRRLQILVVCLVCALLMALLIGTIIYFRLRLHRRRSEAELLLSQIRALQEDLTREGEHTTNLQRAMRGDIRSLLDAQFKVFEELCLIWYTSPISSSSTESLRHGLEKILSRLREPEIMDEMVAVINKYDDGDISRLREDIPTITPQEFRLALYLYVGFSPETIAVLMGKETKRVVYVTKNRLKTKIVESNHPQAGNYLSKLRFDS